MSNCDTVWMWYGHMNVEYISHLMMEKELLASKKQAAIKYIADQMHKTHYGYSNERDMPWWITALEVINAKPISNNKVVLDDIERQKGFELVEKMNAEVLAEIANRLPEGATKIGAIER